MGESHWSRQPLGGRTPSESAYRAVEPGSDQCVALLTVQEAHFKQDNNIGFLFQ